MEPEALRQARVAFGHRLKDERERRDISQEELASAIGKTHGFVSNIETGIRSPSFEVMLDIAAALGTKAASLFQQVRAPIKATYSAEVLQLNSLLKDASPEKQRSILRVVREFVGRRYPIPRKRRF